METKDFYESPSGIVKLMMDGDSECWIHVSTPKNPQGKVMRCVCLAQAKEMFDLTCKKLDPEILLS